MNYEEMKVTELKQIAKDKRVRYWWTLDKAQLIEKIKDRDENPVVLPEVHLTLSGNMIEIPIEADEDDELEEDADLVPMPGIEKLAELKAEVSTGKKRGALLEYGGKSQNICAWAKELGISANTLYGRIYRMGWSVDKAFTTPVKK